jgi:apolipoprotein N-acyltransferase
VQASTVGVSGVISPTGRLVQTTGLFTAEQMYAELPLRDTLTPAVQYRGVWQWVFVGGAVALFSLVVTLRTRKAYEW